MRRALVPITIAVAAVALAACGTESIDVSSSSEDGAEIFAANCAGCHTMTPAGSQGSGNRALRVQGPNLDQRAVSYEDALYAINNGGASGAVMPQNIITGADAEAVAKFIEEYSGTEVEDAAQPSAAGDSESPDASSEPDSGGSSTGPTSDY